MWDCVRYRHYFYRQVEVPRADGVKHLEEPYNLILLNQIISSDENLLVDQNQLDQNIFETFFLIYKIEKNIQTVHIKTKTND